MTTQQPELPVAAPHYALPDSGEQVPTLSWPIVGIFTFAVAVFGASTWAALTHALPVIVTIASSSVAIFVLFTVLHDASHYSISSHRWVNVAFGRVAMFFVSPLISFKSFAFIHIEHHRNTNDGASDPDHFVTSAPRWQLPIRFPVMDLPYISFLVRHVRRRPRAGILETGALLVLSGAVIVWAAFAGHLWMLAVIYLIPERVAMFVLAWWFDWLPHHDLEDTQRENRYRATRNRVGSEWFLTPLLLSQNYHLVHHLHPSVPFYRYVAAWQRNEAAYLERDSAISTVFGQQLDATQYHEWKRLNGKLAALLPIRMPRSSAARHANAHRIPVKSVEPLTPDSVKVTFDVPDHLSDQFQFQAGQHLTVRHRIGGQQVRRNYSICVSATSGELAIAVRHIPDGMFSTFAVETLQAGDVLELMTPTGSFGAPLDPLARRDYVAVAAGSGITPILSVLRTTMEIETESRFTLFYGNRTDESTMFATELDELESRYADRLRIFHIRSADAQHPAHLRGHINLAMVQQLLARDLTSIDRWYLCGPGDLVTTMHRGLTAKGVSAEQIHLELFRTTNRPTPLDDCPASEVTITVSGADHTVQLATGETVLESALKNNIDAPYACLGGACGTCKAKITLGAVSMEQNFALNTAEVEAGFILTCQSHPTTATVAVDYDS
ncbi:fatty acid desaturase [Mycobacteroides salmoniphilum]|uniref:1,2-phenylacetyl-CoA epoxidase, subunit E n=1 Tax=Mycobacteroides salmoniphilum TaxID=404941 RepID=A0A4R8SDL3_9MYCO|nr:fatty acid desaturase [Mycobacteroides salmoniphilum]TDZ93478.1 1,2-phenylacetyl-CoA epoxidase, subunit E [Mycobacteroides salmoniphilum]TEA09261.1 1,2-phenylacetyl-CoA epoxidase, subunit E [Mycobacteroides salmoniphilum]